MRGQFLAAALTLAAPPATAQQAFTGAWTVAAAAPAPWIGKGVKPAGEPALAQAHIVFRPDRLEAPIWIGCRDPQYRITSLPPDGVFEGGLHDPEHGLTNAKALAAKLGFVGTRFPTLEARCSEISFHLAAPDTILFALNDVIYTLKRDKAR